MRVVVLSETDKIAKPSNLELYQKGEEVPEREIEEHAPEQNDVEEVSRIWQEAGAGEGVMEMLEKEGEGEGVEVQNVYFEWVPSRYIDVYVCEEGVLEKEQIRAKSMEKADMEEKMFGGLYQDE